MSKGYKIDFTTNTITMNYTFKKASEEYGTAEYNTLKGILADFPTMKTIVKAGREQKKASKYKNLTYKNMEQYISVLENAEEIMEAFKTIKRASKSQSSSYQYVYNWFESQFPDFRKTPKFKDGKFIKEEEKKPEVKIVKMKFTA
jgi:hypothetical protein